MEIRNPTDQGASSEKIIELFNDEINIYLRVILENEDLDPRKYIEIQSRNLYKKLLNLLNLSDLDNLYPW